ncbi:MAG TPA: STAS domain-containing protein [Dermatophilaceae bacterium]|nr:STAS domain-containing protein [Dermatophilaceae bacterium]
MQHTDRGTELVVAGRLDVHTVADVRRMLHEALDDPAHGSGDLLLHLSGAEVYDATGLGVVVGLHHRARRLGRRVVLLDASPRLERLLRSTRLHRVFHRPKMVSQAVDPALEPA